MKKTLIITLTLVAGMSMAVNAGSETKTPAGKELLLKYKCVNCHSVKCAGLEKKADPTEEKSDKTPPDLSSVGVSRTKEWITKYMLKKEMIKNVKHLKRFKGTEAELSQLADWLVTLKVDTTKAASPR